MRGPQSQEQLLKKLYFNCWKSYILSWQKSNVLHRISFYRIFGPLLFYSSNIFPTTKKAQNEKEINRQNSWWSWQQVKEGRSTTGKFLFCATNRWMAFITLNHLCRLRKGVWLCALWKLVEGHGKLWNPRWINQNAEDLVCGKRMCSTWWWSLKQNGSKQKQEWRKAMWCLALFSCG